MARCTFCRRTMHPGTGTMFIKNDGRIFLFCSSKCEKNQLKLGHVGRKTRWTRAFALEKKKSTGSKEEQKEAHKEEHQ